MLKKLLKYDLRSVGRVWWIAMLTMIGASFSCSISMRLYTELSFKQSLLTNNDNEVLITLALIALYLIFIISAIAMGACILFVAIMVFVRYYKHLFTDEGYLTFTLPVSRRQIFLSKFINAATWMLLSEIVLLICGAVMIVIMIPTYGEGIIATDTLQSFLRGVAEEFESRGAWMIVQGALGILIGVAYTMLSVGVVYFCITLGATVVKRAKIVVGVGAYYLIDIVSRILTTVLGVVPMVWVIMALILFSETTPFMFNSAITLMLVILFAAVALLATFFHCLTLNILERKLNLA